MPFFPALPEPRPATVHPFSALMGGMGAATELKKANADAAIKREALIRSQKERQALEQFQQTGDPNVLTSVMTPQQAMVAKEAHTQQQIQTGLAISQYFDQIKPDLTWENYPKARADAIRQFPALGEQMFPPPEALGNKENFDKWKWSKFEKLAEFKARPQVITAQSRIDAAKIAAGSRERAAEISAGGRVQAASIAGASREAVAEKKGPGGTPITRQLLKDYEAAIVRGDAEPGGFKKWLNQMEADKAKKVQEAKESTPGGQLKMKGTEARTQVSEGKAEKDKMVLEGLRKLLPPTQTKLLAKRTKPDGTVEYKVADPSGKESIMTESELKSKGILK